MEENAAALAAFAAQMLGFTIDSDEVRHAAERGRMHDRLQRTSSRAVRSPRGHDTGSQPTPLRLPAPPIPADTTEPNNEKEAKDMETTIATVALEGTYDVALSLKRHLDLIGEAAANGAKLIVFPEISLQGYPPDYDKLYGQRIADAYANAELVPDGPSVQTIIDKAKALGVYVIFGLNELGDSRGVIYNTVVLTGPDGYVGRYRKVHVGISEQVTWMRGDDWPVFDTEFGKIGMLICYDKMWPESARELTLRGADLLVMSTAWYMPAGDMDPSTNNWGDLYQIYDRCRAAENTRWFVSSNFAGSFGNTNFVGCSQIVDPFGRVVETTGPFAPGIAYATVDIKGGIAKANAEMMMGNRLIRDWRPDTYKAIRGEMRLPIDG